MTVLIVLSLLAAAPLALVVLTALGARKRGMRWPVAWLAGMVFPATWAVWYVRDGAHQSRTSIHA